MIVIRDELAGDPLRFFCAETARDARWILEQAEKRRLWAMDTESTGINCYKPGWKLRTFQFGNARKAFVVPARYKNTIADIVRLPGVRWIGHNGPHDIRSIDQHLGYETGVRCRYETHTVSHYHDPRNRQEGGIGHALKELAERLLHPSANKWEVALKAEFKKIMVPIPGKVYLSGPRRGQPRSRAARLSEGYELISPSNRAYLAYAASDCILTFRVWQRLRHLAENFNSLYQFDSRVAIACDRLQRRAIRLDIEYTERLDRAFTRMAERYSHTANEYGCRNIHSGQQVSAAVIAAGGTLTERTPTGQLKADDRVLRAAMALANDDVHGLINAVLVGRQLLKRRESYTQAFLNEMDEDGRVHPSINTLAARTARMSVSKPALQQLPTKDREGDLE